MDIYLLKNGSKHGPYSHAEVREMLSSGITSNNDMGWREGLTDWIPVGLIVVETTPFVPQSLPVDVVTGLSKQSFRVLVILSIVIFIAYMFACLWQSSSSQTQTSDNSFSDTMGALVILMIVMCPSYIGLLLIKKWGRNLFIVTTVMILILTLFGGQVELSATANVLGSMSDMLTGVIIAVSMFTPLFDS